jgi:hypothetical protein
VIDDVTRVRLHECVRRESRSLMQYAREVPLWAAPNERSALAHFRDLAEAELQATDQLALWLQKNRAGLMHLGPFSLGFTELNDASFRHLLPRMICEQAKMLSELEADAAAVAAPGAKLLVDKMIELKRGHKLELSTLLAPTNSEVH